MAETVTIHDVAAEAKVSIATVSRVLNNASSVKDSTRERVVQAMETVGYVRPEEEPSSASFPSESRTILVMVSHVDNMAVGRQIEGILSSANYAGYDCVIFKRKSEVYNLEELSAIVKNVHAVGLLISWPDVPVDVLNGLNRLCPVVQVNEYNEACNLPFVSVDDYAMGKTATNYLLKLGYRKIGIMCGLSRYKYAKDRLRGYQDALHEAGIEPDPAYNYSFMDLHTRSTASVVVNSANLPEAIIATSDVLAAALVNALRAAGKSIPKDMAIVTCEDTELAQYVYPPLTAMSEPIFHIGEAACKMLIDILKGNNPSPNQITLQADLVVRETT